jgi:hypothetical protein
VQSKITSGPELTCVKMAVSSPHSLHPDKRFFTVNS